MARIHTASNIFNDASSDDNSMSASQLRSVFYDPNLADAIREQILQSFAPVVEKKGGDDEEEEEQAKIDWEKDVS